MVLGAGTMEGRSEIPDCIVLKLPFLETSTVFLRSHPSKGLCVGAWHAALSFELLISHPEANANCTRASKRVVGFPVNILSELAIQQRSEFQVKE